MGILVVENNLFGERLFAVKVISLASITCNLETEMLILTMTLKKYLKISNTLRKYLNTNTNVFDPMSDHRFICCLLIINKQERRLLLEVS